MNYNIFVYLHLVKKISAILLLVFYLLTSCGVLISQHFCGGKLKEISFLSKPDSDGCCGDAKKSKGCCDDQSVIVKIKDTHVQQGKIKAPIDSFVFLDMQHAVSEGLQKFNVFATVFYKSHAPPDALSIPIYLFISTFRI